MAKIPYRDVQFRRKTRQLLEKIVSIVEEYQAQGIRLTLRQLYYQLVARGLVPNRQSEYNKLIRTTRDARYSGLIDWDAIEDRVRVPSIPGEFENIADLVEAAVNSYRLDRWEGQEYYVELFTEKDALSSVLAPIADKWHIPFCVNRGYGSTTAFFDTSKRLRVAIDNKKEPVILYLGDHDPSGLDMVGDIKRRLTEFCHPEFSMIKAFGVDSEAPPALKTFDSFKKSVGLTDEFFGMFGGAAELYIDLAGIRVKHIALTTKQVQQYNPPPNPAKFTDTRAAEYIEEHGQQCWEVDALPPDVLNEIVNKAIGELVDVDRMDAVIEKEEVDKNNLRKWANGLNNEIEP